MDSCAHADQHPDNGNPSLRLWETNNTMLSVLSNKLVLLSKKLSILSNKLSILSSTHGIPIIIVHAILVHAILVRQTFVCYIKQSSHRP